MPVSEFNERTLTAEVLKRISAAPDKRLAQVMQSLVKHLHAFVREIRPTPQEWGQAIRFLTETGRISDDERQEFILLSDTLGVSMLVDFVAYGRVGKATESTAFKIAASGFDTLVTHLFVKGGEFLDSDAVFGVKRSLIVDFTKNEAASTTAATTSY
jgi:catechol 2,3-dioxygenase-like protein